MLRRIPWALVASAIALSATPGSAQVGGVDTALVRVLDRVRPGSDVRVAAGQGAMHRGTLRKLTAAELVVTEDAVERTMPLTAIDTVWVARRSTGRGAWTGALVGLGVGAIVGTAAGANWE